MVRNFGKAPNRLPAANSAVTAIGLLSKGDASGFRLRSGGPPLPFLMAKSAMALAAFESLTAMEFPIPNPRPNLVFGTPLSVNGFNWAGYPAALTE